MTKRMCPELSFVTFVEPPEWCAVQLLTVTAVTADNDFGGIWSDAAVQINCAITKITYR